MKRKKQEKESLINVTSNTIEELLSHLRIYFQKNSFSRKDVDSKPPLRSEVFTKDQMEQHAESLAAIHKLNFEKTQELLLKRLSENEELLNRVINLLQDTIKDKHRISPAGEWLLDNFYLIEEQIITGKKYLPKGYSKGLPRLINTASAGLPRVYDIALEIISHSDGHVDVGVLSCFIAAYQRKSALTIGELWAIPIMLRLALLENLRRVAAKTALDMVDEKLADNWADKIIAGVEKNKKNLVLVIADMARSAPPMVSAFVSPFVQRLQWKGSEVSLVLNWVEQHLEEKGATITSMLQEENQKQAADQVSMSNSISSLRFLAKMDWREFVETMSVVEQTLREDKIYPEMDFYTRDSYRHAIEKIAKNSVLSENEIARLAIMLSRNESFSDEEERKKHVGYYLIGKGAEETKKAANQKLTFKEKWHKYTFKNKKILYSISALIVTCICTFVLVLEGLSSGINRQWIFPFGFLVLICCSHFAIAIVNWIATLLVKPEHLPRMNYSSGIPNESRTMVVVPCMLSNNEQVKKLAEELEVRFLANRDKNLLYTILTDFQDSKYEIADDDATLINTATNCINSLNKKYSKTDTEIFYLFHRPRRWNKTEKIWMGWERKRGKLTNLNQLINGKGKENFSVIVGDEKIYRSVKYIITLDADTQLPREAAWKMVGIMSHPLNKPFYNTHKKRVTEGYGIIQPRIAISLHGAVRSWYTRMHENDSGIDPYTRVTSEVYQDIFNEGSFIGKGIYEVETFLKVLEDRFPENRILSHDLLEGSYTRCAFASDVQLYEEYPWKYSIDISRRYRWIRGDWQIWNWFLGYVPDAQKKLYRNPLSLLSKWKIFDNLRRSLVPVFLLLLLIIGWTLLDNSWFWTAIVTAIILLPSLITSAWDILQKPPDVILKHHIEQTINSIFRNILYAAFTIICLPYEAYISAKAISVTVWRMIVSKKKLLQWNPSGFDSGKASDSLIFIYKKMWFTVILTVSLFIYLIVSSIVIAFMAFPFFVAWTLSPFLVWWLSKPLLQTKKIYTLKANEKEFLEKISRRTWAFFEDFVGKEDNWLPPDNFQQHPIPITAHRTSPTNIGLSLLSNLGAYDFGYITITSLIQRTKNTFSSLHKLERYSGHFYNWYDTQTLKTLNPRYISTVDSGNLGGHLLTLKQGFLEIANKQIISHQFFHGLKHTVFLLEETSSENIRHLIVEIKFWIEKYAQQEYTTIIDFKNNLDNLEFLLKQLDQQIVKSSPKEDRYWLDKILYQLNDQSNELIIFKPWFSIPEKFNILGDIRKINSFNLLADSPKTLKKDFENFTDLSIDEKNWFKKFLSAIENISELAQKTIHALISLSNECDDFANMEYDFLYDKAQHLLTIGYNVNEHKKDASYYDLLASEARLASFVAIAQGKISQENWFALGRRLTHSAGLSVLLSWSGSMFEYLMPNLIMPSYDNTLLDRTNNGIIRRQIEYGKQQNIPWGISESCYNMVDANLNYQYKAFGVPELGFKRGLGDDLVIAPYATIMSLMVDPKAGYENLQKLSQKGFKGKYGYYESVDFTPRRLPRGKHNILIQSFMVHHQGMSFLSLIHYLLHQPMQKRFELEPAFQSTLLLLQEQVPKASGYYTAPKDSIEIHSSITNADIRIVKNTENFIPEIQLLSNGNYHVMISNTGSGYSKWNNYAITRWQDDFTTDNYGSFCFIRDLDSGIFWSNTYQPTLKQTESYEAVFSQGRAEFKRIDHDIETHSEIIVSPEDNIEIKRIQITNTSNEKKRIEITTYAEVVLASFASDIAHPAFSNLFVETQIISTHQAIICSRRPMSNDEQIPLMFHMIKVVNDNLSNISYETSREKFIGRGYNLMNPISMHKQTSLSNTSGYVLDPIVSIRVYLQLEKEESISFDIVTGINQTKKGCQNLIEKYHDKHIRDRAFELSWTHNQVILRQINATDTDAQLYSILAGSIIYPNKSFRAPQNILSKNFKSQSSLWSYSISGDLPIVLLQIAGAESIALVRQIIQAKAYWQLKGLSIDLVIWNEDQSGYRQTLQEEIQNVINAGNGIISDQKTGIVLKSANQISQEDRILLQTVARIIISDRQENIFKQILKKQKAKKLTETLTVLQAALPGNAQDNFSKPVLEYFNNYGGFSKDSHEYIISTNQENVTPAPWINVLTNENFGTIISENGSSYSWFINSHEFRLTPWSNDPVCDNGGEAFYIRDEKSGIFWSPMPYPSCGKSVYLIAHSFGFSKFENSEAGILTETKIFTDVIDPVKFIAVKIKNTSGRKRSLSATGFMQLILADLHTKSQMFVITSIFNSAILAKNTYNAEFNTYMVFFDTDIVSSFTTDRTEFIGRNKNLHNPQAMENVDLSNTFGAGFDPCAALQYTFDLENDEEKEIVFRLGAAINQQEAEKLVKKYKGNTAAKQAFQRVNDFWQKTLSQIIIETPENSLNILSNKWLLYQLISSRLWARSGFYQSGGAYGFRDQLQDVLALATTHPELVRKQILLAASRQFKEGDAQHWWHPPSGRGVRTKCSDDFLWLPFVTANYCNITSDIAILEEEIHFIEGRPLNQNEESYYDLPVLSETSSFLYDHCKRAITNGLHFGEHGLPLIGSGDWNDGMNLVGIEGKGESVWLGFFLYTVLKDFEQIAITHHDKSFADECAKNAERLKTNLNKNAWDGNWFLRGFFDNGTPLGSSKNEECKIDSIAQSWSVISGAGDNDKTNKALDSLNKYLVKRDAKLIQLLDPPFNKSEQNPGYIKGYVPGVRENGGQYTHAAIWAIMAYAKAGENELAWELLQMINPINHTQTKEDVEKYKTEPYVIAADVYASDQHKGRGGWTWYTGSAGWAYQLILHSILGMQKVGNKLFIKPCTPKHWQSYKMHYKYLSATYHITVQINNEIQNTVIVADDATQSNNFIQLEDDGKEHNITITTSVKKQTQKNITNNLVPKT